MKSMTGFGRGVSSGASFQVAVEISAVNSRKQIEMRLFVPRELMQVEPEIRGAVQRRLSRGTLNISVSYQRTDINGAMAALPVDLEFAAGVCRTLKQFAEDQGLAAPTLQDVLQIPGVLKNDSLDLEELRPQVLEALEQALDVLDGARSQEGVALRQDLVARGEVMNAIIQKIEELERGSGLAMQERLMERIRNLKIELGAEDERLAKEVAFLVDKSDITEEMVRLKTHLAHYARLMDEENDVGRNLDFLCQEMNREINTLGAKCSEHEISQQALAMKVELSKVREQIMNVE